MAVNFVVSINNFPQHVIALYGILTVVMDTIFKIANISSENKSYTYSINDY